MPLLQKTTGILSLAIVVVLIVLFLLVFDRYTYYDYRASQCRGDGGRLVAELVGRFERETPRVRGGPYYLRLEVMPGAGDVAGSVDVKRLALASMNSGGVLTPAGSDLHFRRVRKSDDAVLFASNDLKLPYEDYRLTGVLVDGSSATGRTAAFSCTLLRQHWREWRIPLLDALMSV